MRKLSLSPQGPKTIQKVGSDKMLNLALYPQREGRGRPTAWEWVGGAQNGKKFQITQKHQKQAQSPKKSKIERKMCGKKHNHRKFFRLRLALGTPLLFLRESPKITKKA